MAEQGDRNGSLYSAGLCCIKMTAQLQHCNCSVHKQENGFPHSSQHNSRWKSLLKATQSQLLIREDLASAVVEVAQGLPQLGFECFRGRGDTTPFGSLFQFLTPLWKEFFPYVQLEFLLTTSLVLGSPDLITVFQMQPPQC